MNKASTSWKLIEPKDRTCGSSVKQTLHETALRTGLVFQGNGGDMCKGNSSILVHACRTWLMALVVGAATCASQVIAEGWGLSGGSWAPQGKTVQGEGEPTTPAPAGKSVSPPSTARDAGNANLPLPPASTHQLADAVAKGMVAFRLAGLNNDVEMNLSLENMTAKEISVRVPQGTVFIPASEGVQRMLLRSDVLFRLPPRKTGSQTVPVLCMDVAKDPPSVRDSGWTQSFDTGMNKLVEFTKKVAAEESARRSDVTQDQIERFLLRFVVWRNNGATAADFADFIRKYGAAEEKKDAEARSQELTQTADRILLQFRGKQ